MEEALHDKSHEDYPVAVNRLWQKMQRQGEALTRLQRRVENQRATLRVLDELGRSLTTDEFNEHIRGAKDHTGEDLTPVEV